MELRKHLCWLLGHETTTEWIDNDEEGSHLQYIYCIHCDKVFVDPEDTKRLLETIQLTSTSSN